MGYAEIACCKRCEIPVKTLDETGIRHLCERCEEIKIHDDLIYLDISTAIMNAKAIEELDKSIKLVDHALDLLIDIRKAIKND
jgi:hypothetical protein